MRRNFLKKAFLLSSAGLFPFVSKSSYNELISSASDLTLPSSNLKTSEEEVFWNSIRKEYTNNSSIINFNNGGVNPSPSVVNEAVLEMTKLFNEIPSYYMWRIYSKNLEFVREKLATFCNVSTEELALTRNATESLSNIIFGIDLSKGDEIIRSNWDYPNMENSWEQRVKRDGIVVKQAQLPIVSENDDEIVESYRKLITPKTKVLYITHIFNWTGQILPVKKLCQLAQENGILSVVDAAHSIGQLKMDIGDVGCDYLGASLHKWLGAPIGTGLLYMKKEHIANTWPSSSAPEPQSSDIKKFENYGTYPVANKLAILHAIQFNKLIGQKRKEDRLRQLKNYWAKEIRNIDRVRIYSSLEDNYSCGIASFGIDGMDSKSISRYLFQEKSIHTTLFDKNGKTGVRISPNIYSNFNELDLLIESVYEITR